MVKKKVPQRALFILSVRKLINVLRVISYTGSVIDL